MFNKITWELNIYRAWYTFFNMCFNKRYYIQINVQFNSLDFHGKINELTDIFSSCFLVCIFELAIIVFFFNLVSKFHLLTKSQFSISLLRSKNVNQHIMSFAELYIIFHFCFLIFCYQKRLLPAKPHGFAMRIMAYIRISRSHRKARKTLTSSTIFFFYTH